MSPWKCTFHGHIHFKNFPIFLCQHNVSLNQLSQTGYVPLPLWPEQGEWKFPATRRSKILCMREPAYWCEIQLFHQFQWHFCLLQKQEFGQVSLQPLESNCTTFSCPLGERRSPLLHVSHWLSSQTAFLPLNIQNIRGKQSSPCTLSGWLTKSPVLIFLTRNWRPVTLNTDAPLDSQGSFE